MTERVNDEVDSAFCKRPLPQEPTSVRPGPDKVRILRARHESGTQLHHPNDTRMDDEDERPSAHSGHWGFGDGVDSSALESDWGCSDGGDY